MKTKKYTKRADVPRNYTWDLEAALKGQTIEQILRKYSSLRKELTKVKDSKYQSSESFLQALKKEDKLSLVENQVYSYLSNGLSENVVDSSKQKLVKDFEYMSYQFDLEEGPENARIFANAAKVTRWIQDPKFKNYRVYFERILETKKHQLPKTIQEFRNKESRADFDAEELFSIIVDSEMNFGQIEDGRGKKHQLTQGNYNQILENRDKTLRKNAFNRLTTTRLKHKNSLANLLYQHFKSETVWAKLQKFNSTVDYLVYDDRASEKVLLSLYEGVQTNLKVFRDYRNLYRRVYKAKFHESARKYDFNVPLLPSADQYDIPTTQKLVLKALEPFGGEYTGQVQKAFKERWIDYFETPNKRGGAYSAGRHGIEKKYILMNHDGSFRSVETLAHEVGHSLHSYFSEKSNHIRNSSYRIFVAEIASIFNELMLFDHLLSTSQDKKLKFKIRQRMAKGFEGTVYRQILWSNYEYDLYKQIEQGQALSTYEQIAKLYYQNEQRYALTKEKYNERNQTWAVCVPHFYYSFYVYKYAIGQLVANIIFARYKKEGTRVLQDYVKNFLSVGGSLTPLETIRNIGINLEDPKIINEGFVNAKENIRELQKLAKDLFKV